MVAGPISGPPSILPESFFVNRQIAHPVAIIVFFLLAGTVTTKSANGCILYDEICEKDEICVRDGLLGECASTERVALIVSNPTNYMLKKTLRSQLAQLGRDGYTLEDARTQCVIAYFKMVLVSQLEYDPGFCNVAHPENVWRLLQAMKVALINDATDDNSDSELISNFIKQLQQRQRHIAKQVPRHFLPHYTGDVEMGGGDRAENDFNLISERNVLGKDENLQSTIWDDAEKTLSGDKDVLAVENFIPLADQSSREDDESMNFISYHAPVLKKDIEHLGNQNTGLEKIEHKIVKGMPSYQKVNGNRVYLKVAEDLDDDKLRHLIDYLDFSIAKPNQLIFDDFLLDGDQLSFRAGRSRLAIPENEKRLDSVGGIAEDVYKRRKDIQTISGIRVDETGIGSGEEVVPIQSEARDRFFVPILAVSTVTLVLLVAVMAIHQVKEYRKKIRKSIIMSERDSEKYDDKTLLAYQDLCRYQMGSREPAGIADAHTNHSGITSWVDEPVGQSSLDISTGHVILSFLRDYLNDTSKIEGQWQMLNSYSNPNGISSIAREEKNINKNRNPSCLPYDDTLVSIRDLMNDSTFINASAIHDCDPKQANYIATQSPLPETIADFWQMIWEKATVLIVNLSNNDDQQDGRCLNYWPESGSQIYGSFEIHLVSEHIWSEDYLVRSFYLKNLRTSETRTVTQFHFLTWPKGGVPSNTKALLDFRRKINKSYRGKAAPIVVHCTDGTGRTGTFCLLDMILNRVAKGVKELNVAGSLEHLRDQRPGMVESCEQYKMVFVCLAEEITAIVAALSYTALRKGCLKALELLRHGGAFRRCHGVGRLGCSDFCVRGLRGFCRFLEEACRGDTSG
ncbi:unnamed protein product [Litomosoides sigmodontis]|uniref:Tyrosine-protein phosphatase domain-containing protein n=1 Tax=Litomosoides sigmodontis TaxID=42156 RepID=A0A3P6S815_LITSI|nr:unnamed protein product [Litomosoides sigmodontis]